MKGSAVLMADAWRFTAVVYGREADIESATPVILSA